MKRNRLPVKQSRRTTLSGIAMGLLSGCLNVEQTNESEEEPELTTSDNVTRTKQPTVTEEDRIDIPKPSGEWPQYRHDPQNTGHIDKEIDLSFPKVEILDSFGESVKGITVGDPYLYIQLLDRLVAFNPHNRTVEWEVENAQRGQPVFYDGVVYTTSHATSRDTLALDAETGDRVWHTTDVIGDAFVLTNHENLLIGGGSKTGLLNPVDGSTIWRTGTELGRFPIILGNRIVGGEYGEKTVTGIDRKTGETVWTEEVGEYLTHRLTGKDGTVFVGSRTDGGNPNLFIALSAETGERQWTVELEEYPFSAPAITNDQAIVETTDSIRSFDIGTGEMLWKTEYRGALVMSKNYIFGEYYVLDRANGDLFFEVNNLRIENISAQSLSEGALFGGTQAGILFAIV